MLWAHPMQGFMPEQVRQHTVTCATVICMQMHYCQNALAPKIRPVCSSTCCKPLKMLDFNLQKNFNTEGLQSLHTEGLRSLHPDGLESLHTEEVMTTLSQHVWRTTHIVRSL